MKHALIVFCLLTASQTFAKPIDEAAAKNLPARLKCVAPAARSKAARKFTITKLNTDEPETTLREGFQEMTTDGNKLTVSFSDECEGWYAVTLNMKAVTLLKQGGIKAVTGVLEYDDLPEFFDDASVKTVESGDNQHDKTMVTCKLMP